MSDLNGYCPRCGIKTHAPLDGHPQVCRDCRSVDPIWTRQWPTAREVRRQQAEKREREGR